MYMCNCNRKVESKTKCPEVKPLRSWLSIKRVSTGRKHHKVYTPCGDSSNRKSRGIVNSNEI